MTPTKTDGRQISLSTETEQWVVIKATDAEVTTGTEDTKYITPEQLKNRGFDTTEWQLIFRNQADASTTIVYPHSLWAIPKSITFKMNVWNNITCNWIYDWSNKFMMPSSSTTNITGTSHVIRSTSNSTHQIWAVSAVTDTNYSITWTNVGSASTANMAILAIISI